jgi:hypothetical protein
MCRKSRACPYVQADAPSGRKHKDSGGMLCEGLSDDVQHHTVDSRRCGDHG